MPLLKGFFAFFAHIFGALFHSMHDAYNKLSPEQQQSLVHGSGIIDILTSTIGKAPQEVRACIKEKYPALNETDIEDALFVLANAFNVTHESTLDGVITALQNYLSSKTGKVWDAVTHGASSLLAFILGPEDMKFAAVTSLMEYVYQHIIKKHPTQPAQG